MKYKQCCGRADRTTPEGAYDRIRKLDGAASDAIGHIIKQTHDRDEFLGAHAEFHPGQIGPLDPDDPEVEFFLRWFYQQGAFLLFCFQNFIGTTAPSATLPVSLSFVSL